MTSTQTVVLEAVLGDRVFELPITIHPRVTEIVIPQTVVGGDPFTGTVALAGPSSGDTGVRLSSSWAIMEVQSRVTIPAGETSATFTGTTRQVDGDAQVFVTGDYGSNSEQSGWMTLTP